MSDAASPTPAPMSAPSSSRKNYKQLFTEEMFKQAVCDKFQEAQDLFMAGPDAWRKTQIAAHKAKAAELVKLWRKTRTDDLQATATVYLNRLEADFGDKSNYEQFNGKWISTYDCDGKYTLEELNSDDLADNVAFCSATLLCDQAVAKGFTPLGIVSHNRTKVEGGADYAFKFGLGDQENLRVYVGGRMSFDSSDKRDAHPLALVKNDKRFIPAQPATEEEVAAAEAAEAEAEVAAAEAEAPEPEVVETPAPSPAPKKVPAKPRRRAKTAATTTA